MMRQTPTAVGYLRTDISREHQQWDETQMRSRAAKLGYILRKTVAFSARTDHPVEQLADVVQRTAVDAVITPGPEHFEGGIPEAIVQLADVITVNPDRTYARWSTGALPRLNGAE